MLPEIEWVNDIQGLVAIPPDLAKAALIGSRKNRNVNSELCLLGEAEERGQVFANAKTTIIPALFFCASKKITSVNFVTSVVNYN